MQNVKTRKAQPSEVLRATQGVSRTALPNLNLRCIMITSEELEMFIDGLIEPRHDTDCGGDSCPIDFSNDSK